MFDRDCRGFNGAQGMPDTKSPPKVPNRIRRDLVERRERAILEIADLTRMILSLPEYLPQDQDSAYYSFAGYK